MHDADALQYDRFAFELARHIDQTGNTMSDLVDPKTLTTYVQADRVVVTRDTDWLTDLPLYVLHPIDHELVKERLLTRTTEVLEAQHPADTAAAMAKDVAAALDAGKFVVIEPTCTLWVWVVVTVYEHVTPLIVGLQRPTVIRAWPEAEWPAMPGGPIPFPCNDGRGAGA